MRVEAKPIAIGAAATFLVFHGQSTPGSALLIGENGVGEFEF